MYPVPTLTSTHDPIRGVPPAPVGSGVTAIVMGALRSLVLIAVAVFLTVVALPAVLIAAGT